MLFGRSNSSTSYKKASRDNTLISQPRPSHDGRVSFGDGLLSRPTPEVSNDRKDEWRFCQTTRSTTPLPPVASSTNPSVRTHFHGPPPVYANQSSHVAGRNSISSWVSSAQTDRTINTVMHDDSSSAGEFQSMSVASLSLFPRPESRRSINARRSSSRPSTSLSRPSTDIDDIYGSIMPTKRRVPGRFADSLRMSKKRLKHSASKLSLVSSVDEADEPGKSRPLRATCTVHKSSLCKCATRINCSISGPLNFRHVTHALPQQFSDMEKRNQSDLVADFSAMRASQLPRLDLTGIKAMELEHCRSSFDTLPTPPRSAVPSLASSSSLDSLDGARPSSRASTFCTLRSKDSFSRPFLDGRVPRLDNTCPSRPSSRASSIAHHENACREADVLYKEMLQPVQEVQTLSPLDELAWELSHLNTTSFEPELPSVNEAEVLTITPGRAAPYQVKSLSAPHHKEVLSFSSDTPALIIASDRESHIDAIINSLLESRKELLAAEFRASMLRSSITNGMCTSWTFDDDE